MNSSSGETTVGMDESSGVNGTARWRRFGDYELQEEIARGGMGVVYRARQVSLQRTVAVKMILRGELATAADVQRFRTEAEAAAGLDHPHIVPIYEIGAHEGQHYFSMKFIEVGTPSRGKRNQREAARLVARVARAVHHAHQRGILHRDLKPANILIDAAGEPHVTDFGLAKRVEGDQEQTQTGAIVGTPSYMPPEQATGARVLTTAIDVYALGAVLYEWLTGKPPFRGATPLDTLRQVVDQEPVPPQSMDATIDRDLEVICLKCLEKNPAQRYGSAEAVADDLQRWLSGEPIQARRISYWERSCKWARRHPAVAALTALILAVVILAFGLVAWKWRDESIARTDAASKAIAEEKAKNRAITALAAEATAKINAQRAREQAEASLYFNQVALAHSEWHAGNVGRAEELLDRCPVARRGWEWHYLKRVCHRDRFTLHGHKNLVNCVAYSPDGRLLASGSHSKKVRIWDATSGTFIRELTGHKDIIRGVAFSSQGKWLATASDDGAVMLWDVASGKLLHKPLTGHTESVCCVVFSPDDKLVVSGSNRNVSTMKPGTVKIWGTASGQEVHTFPGYSGTGWPGPVHSVAFRSDGERLALACGSRIRIVDTASWQELQSLPVQGSDVLSLAFSPNGKQLASCNLDGAVKVWDLERGVEHRIWWHGNAVRGVAFSADGRLLASASEDQTVVVWDIAKGKAAHVLRGHKRYVQAVAFCSKRPEVASASFDGTVKVWDLTAAHEALVVQTHIGTGLRTYLAFSPDSQLLACAAGNHLRLSQLPGGKERWRKVIPGLSARQVAFSTNGTTLAVADGDGLISLRNAFSGEEMFRIPAHTGPTATVAFSPDGRHLASGGNDRMIHIWDASTGKRLHSLAGHRMPVACLAYSPDGQRLASGAGVEHANGEFKLWDVWGGTELGEQKQRQFVHTVAFSPDGDRLATACGAGPVHLWSLRPKDRLDESTKPIVTFSGHSDYVRSVAFSSNGQRLVSGGDDNTVRIWDALSGEPTLTLRGHSSWVSVVAFSPNGRYIASCELGGVIKVWDGGPWE